MDLLLPLMCIAGGILAASGLILAKKPNAAELIGKIQPYQATIGIALLAWGIYNLFINIGISVMMAFIKFAPLFGISILGMLACSILLGILFGMPMLAKLSAGGAAKGEELGKKLAGVQVLIGVIAIVSSLVFLLYRFQILKLG